MFDLTGKNALVTGASRGIGQGIALALAQAGANVAVNYHSNQQEAQAVSDQITKMGRKSLIIQADVSDESQVKAMFNQFQSQWQKVDILVNNAGVITFKPFEELGTDEWDKIIDVNLKGQFLCSREAVKMMETTGGGSIVNIASVAAGQVGVGFPSLAHYCASKGGVVALTEELALELGPKNIRVNAIAPGVIDTDMAKSVTGSPDSLKNTLARVPRGRIGKPEDIGHTVVFLASDEADYITGVMLPVDGGWLAG